MRGRLLILLLGMLALGLPRVGAQTFTGRVVGDSARALSGVSVVLLDSARRGVSFSRSAADGSFSVTGRAGRPAAWLLFSCAGYERDTLSARDFRDGQTVQLREQTLSIREVTVSAGRIREQGDTLNYNVGSFRQKQDRSIADVIRKMPGLNVRQDGTIEYEGKAINKFYVEGMDLMGSKYAQTSENLQADKVKRVQVMRNHQPVKALKDISFSEQAALNIVLEDDARNVWQGVADLAAGPWPPSHGEGLGVGVDSRFLAMVFARRMQSVSMYKLNNTGKDVGREVADIGSLADYAPTETGLLSNISLGAPQLDQRRSRFNRTHVLATNWLFRTRPDTDLRLQLNALLDRTSEQRLTETTYTDLPDGATVAEDVQARAYRRHLSGELLYKVNRDRLYVSNSLKGYLGYDRSHGTTLLNGTATPERVRPHERYLTDQLQLIRTFRNGRTANAHAYLSYNYLPGQLLLTDASWQQLRLSSLLWGARTGFSHRLGQATMSYTLSEDAKHQRMETANLLASAEDTYAEHRTRLSPSLSWRHAGWRLQLAAPLLWLHRRLDDRHAATGPQHSSRLLLEPRLFGIYEPTQRWQFMALYNYAWNPLDVKTVSSTPVFTSYINLQQGGGRLDHTTAHSVSGHVQYRHTAKGFFAQLATTLSRMRHSTLYRSTLVGNVYRREATDQQTAVGTCAVSGRVSEAFRWAHLSVALTGDYNWSHYDVLQGERRTPFLMRSATASLRTAVQPLPWLSFEEQSGWQYSRQRERGSTVGTSPDALRSFTHTVKVFVMPGAWQLEWCNEFYHSNDRSVSFNAFSDLSVSYRKPKYELGLQCYNLFGNSRYERRTVAATTHTYTLNRLRPREVLARLLLNW